MSVCLSTLSHCLLFVLLIVCSQAGKLPIQAHSFNDLAYTSNLIKKGIDYFKLDISMANRQSCSVHSSWNSSRSCLKTKQYIQDICCLALRGDASSRPHFTADFSTSDDLLEFFKRELAQVVVNEPKRKLLFAINFQYDHFFEDTLTQKFLSELVDIMEKYPNNLLIGTGSDSFILEYDRICFAKSTSCTQIRKKISNSKIFLQSSAMQPFDSRDHYKRFRNFNVFYKEIERFCSSGFPEWIDKYPEFPLIFWEPSNEQQIQYVFNTFTSPSCMKQHGRNISGMAMAINIDSQMFDFYVKKTVEPIVFNNWLLPYKTDISVSNISFLSSAQKIILSEQENMRITKIKNSRYETIFVASQNVFTHRLLLQKWDFDELSGYTKLVQNQEFPNVLADDEKIISLMQDGLTNLVIVTVNEKANKSRGYYFRSTDFFQLTGKDMQIVKAVTMRGEEIIYVSCDKSDSSCKIKGTSDLKQIKEYANVDISLFLTKVTSIVCRNKTSFILAGDSAKVTDGAALVMISQGKVYPTSMELSLGHNPKIFKKESGRQYGVILEDSMCHSALLINNNGMNKCSFFKDPSYKSLRNVQGLVNLLEFNLQDVLGNQEVISSCHPKIFLTKLMNAKNPDILELPTLGSYFIASEYLRVEDQDVTSALFCGGSNFEKKYKYYQRSSMLGSIYLSIKDLKGVESEEYEE